MGDIAVLSFREVLNGITEWQHENDAPELTDEEAAVLADELLAEVRQGRHILRWGSDMVEIVSMLLSRKPAPTPETGWAVWIGRTLTLGDPEAFAASLKDELWSHRSAHVALSKGGTLDPFVLVCGDLVRAGYWAPSQRHFRGDVEVTLKKALDAAIAGDKRSREAGGTPL